VHADLQILIGQSAGRALPQKFFGGHVGKVVFVVSDFKDELIDLYRVVIHRPKFGAYLGIC